MASGKDMSYTDASKVKLIRRTSEPMILPLWRSLYSLNLMLPKVDRQ